MAMSPLSQSVSHSGGRVPLWMVVVAAMGVWTGDGSATVHASCGDYLHHRLQTMGGTRSLLSDASLPDPLLSGDLTPGVLAPSTPCSGPACRRAPDAPADPLPVDKRSSHTERLALPPAPYVISACCGSLPRAGNRRSLLEDHRAGLDRPPRSA